MLLCSTNSHPDHAILIIRRNDRVSPVVTANNLYTYLQCNTLIIRPLKRTQSQKFDSLILTDYCVCVKIHGFIRYWWLLFPVFPTLLNNIISFLKNVHGINGVTTYIYILYYNTIQLHFKYIQTPTLGFLPIDTDCSLFDWCTR